MELTTAQELYCNAIGIDEEDFDEEEFDDAYVGEYYSIETFVKEQLQTYEGDNGPIPDWIVVDEKATWECSLKHDYYEEGKYGELHFFRHN